MAFQLTTENVSDFTTTVKNTFICLECKAEDNTRRRSVPAKSRLCQESQGLYDGKLIVSNIDGLYTHAEGSETFSGSGTITPLSSDDQSPFSCGSPLPFTQVAPPPRPPRSTTPRRRLNAKAAVFQPCQNQIAMSDSTKDTKDHYKKQIADVIRVAKEVMIESEHVMNVEASEDTNGWSVIVQPNSALADNQWQTELLITLVKEALLDAAARSKCVYVMGYCAPKPFDMRSLGFDARLAAMTSAREACWHVFKKGFCRHGDVCIKQHPACEVPVRVIVEGVQFNSCPRFAGVFKDKVGDLALSVTATLNESPYVELVEAFNGKDNQGWTIEVTAKPEFVAHREYLLTLAKNALFGASSNSETVYIMGYATRPFISKSNGFVTILGDMQDESRVCWDLYAKGSCNRDCACRWEHPECLMPLNVVLKEGSTCADATPRVVEASTCDSTVPYDPHAHAR